MSHLLIVLADFQKMLMGASPNNAQVHQRLQERKEEFVGSQLVEDRQKSPANLVPRQKRYSPIMLQENLQTLFQQLNPLNVHCSGNHNTRNHLDVIGQ